MGEKQEEKVEKKLTEQLCEKVEEQLKKIVEQGITPNNVDYAYKLVDIHKDLANENYWKVKEENYMRYREYGEGYGEYNEGGYGEGYGRRYGRRGVKGTGRGRYRGEDPMEEMRENYEEYNEASEYGAEGAMQKSAEGISKSALEIMKELLQAGDPQVKHIVQKTAKKILEMSEMM